MMAQNRFFWLSIFLIASNLDAQVGNRDYDFDSQPNRIEDYRARSNFSNSYNRSGSLRRSDRGLVESDMGMQRPVKTKKSGFAYHVGFDTKLYYTDNVNSVPDDSSFHIPAGIWENAFRNQFILGTFDLGGASFMPQLGINYSHFHHFGDDFFDSTDIDFGALGINFSGVFQFSGGWSIKPDLAYSSTLTKGDVSYSQFSPSLALGKSFSMGSAKSFIEWSLGYHMTDARDQPITDKLDRVETSLLWAIIVPLGNFELSPLARLAYTDYSNQSRSDVSVNLGLQLAYSFTDWLSIKVYSNFTGKNSDKADYDFSRFDLGAGASFNASF
jgi:hypothetical protein